MPLEDRFGLCQGCTFCFDINGQVFAGGVYAGVAQPVGNGGDINSRAQQVYGGTRAACFGAGRLCGRAGSAPNPNPVSISFAGDKAFPVQRAAALFRPRPSAKIPPTASPGTAIPARPSSCAAVKPPPATGKRFAHNRRAARDWNKTPAGPGKFLRQRRWDHCPTNGCAGSARRDSRNADKATA